MATQSEQALENLLIKQLESLEYERVTVFTEADLLVNLKSQLEKHNKTTFSETEFKRITNHLQKGNVFDKAKIVRDKFVLPLDNGKTKYIEFLDTEHWCQNLFQVTNQVTIKGEHTNRYDVTILINGLPLVQIELKKRGVELKQAFNQIGRYHRDSYRGLFTYTQMFVISNGVNTKYFSNNPKQSFEQTFYWTDEENRKITKLDEFANAFLEKCKVSEMIAEHIVLAESLKIPMILRPYQYYAVEAIEKRVRETDKNGYIWHTTGSGKTLTSFKTSQVLSKIPEVKKILFVVDRKDLDIQTTKEFNSFSDGSVDGTDNTLNLVEQLKDENRKLIVTTIQKLNTVDKTLTGIQTNKGEYQADKYIIALGSASADLVSPIGMQLPIYPVKGYSITVPVKSDIDAPQGTLMDETYKVAITRLGDTVRVAGIAELTGYDKTLSKSGDRITQFVLNDLFPKAVEQVPDDHLWAGLRPMTPDGTPIIGKTPYDNLFLNTGHGTLGWTMGLGSGKIINSIVSGEMPEIDIEGLDMFRYQ